MIQQEKKWSMDPRFDDPGGSHGLPGQARLCDCLYGCHTVTTTMASVQVCDCLLWK